MANPRTIARLEAQILRRAAHCLQFEVSDPRAAFVTLIGVELSKDLSQATIRYSVLGGEGDISKAQHLMKDAGSFIQRQVARALKTRTTPRLRLEFDDSIAEAARMDQLIKKARDRDRQISGQADLQQTESSEPTEEPDPSE